MEEGSDTPVNISVDLIVAKVIDGSDLVSPAELALEPFTRGQVTTIDLGYNATYIDTALISHCDKHSIKIDNDIELKGIFGNDYPSRVRIGKRDYELSYSVDIYTSTWYLLSKLKVPNFAAQYGTSGFYATAIDSVTHIERGTDDYVDFRLSHLAIDEGLENKFASWETNQGMLNLDVTLYPAPDCALTCEVKDALSAAYYEKGGA
jgi:hypothetical protein